MTHAPVAFAVDANAPNVADTESVVVVPVADWVIPGGDPELAASVNSAIPHNAPSAVLTVIKFANVVAPVDGLLAYPANAYK